MYVVPEKYLESVHYMSELVEGGLWWRSRHIYQIRRREDVGSRAWNGGEVSGNDYQIPRLLTSFRPERMRRNLESRISHVAQSVTSLVDLLELRPSVVAHITRGVGIMPRVAHVGLMLVLLFIRMASVKE